MDKNGDSEGNYILLGLVKDEEGYCNQTGSAFVTIGNFFYNQTKYESGEVFPVRSMMLRQIRFLLFNCFRQIFVPNNKTERILWPQGMGSLFIPKSEPECGFNNEHCPLTNNPFVWTGGTLALILFGGILIWFILK